MLSAATVAAFCCGGGSCSLDDNARTMVSMSAWDRPALTPTAEEGPTSTGDEDEEATWEEELEATWEDDWEGPEEAAEGEGAVTGTLASMTACACDARAPMASATEEAPVGVEDEVLRFLEDMLSRLLSVVWNKRKVTHNRSQTTKLVSMY